jgi:hypothetical protein
MERDGGVGGSRRTHPHARRPHTVRPARGGGGMTFLRPWSCCGSGSRSSSNAWSCCSAHIDLHGGASISMACSIVGKGSQTRRVPNVSRRFPARNSTRYHDASCAPRRRPVRAARTCRASSGPRAGPFGSGDSTVTISPVARRLEGEPWACRACRLSSGRSCSPRRWLVVGFELREEHRPLRRRTACRTAPGSRGTRR